jgi:quinolinate synthase
VIYGGENSKMDEQVTIDKINELKKEKNAVILAHNYQIPEIQDIADYVGDSLELSKKAAETDADIIVFCGVYFMAESAKILSPDKKVLLPVSDAGCPMADMIDPHKLKVFKEEYPNIPVVCYIKSSSQVKAESDICCTSSNALRIVKSLKEDTILFVPDQNLGNYIATKVPEKEIICWEGLCITHNRVKHNELDMVRKHRGNIKVLVHPECNPQVVKKADFVGSISEITEYVKGSNEKKFIIGTEMGILHSLRKQNPHKKFYLLSPSLVCYNMKKTSLEDVYKALRDGKNEINIDKKAMDKARESLERMLRVS